MKKILFISSTGGHLTELLQLSPLFSEYDYHIITEKTKSNMNLYNKYGKDHVDMLVYGTKSHLIPYLFKFTYNCIKSYVLFKKIKRAAFSRFIQLFNTILLYLSLML